MRISDWSSDVCSSDLPGLLTLHAVNALNQADIVIYDALVGEAILGCARPGAVLEYSGKRGGKPSPKQRDISLRLAELARQGRSEERRVGIECVSTCRPRWSPDDHKKKETHKTT